MSIACPNCNTNFTVSKNQLGFAGRKVKCSQCQHIWYQKLNSNNEDASKHNSSSVLNCIPKKIDTNETEKITVEKPIYLNISGNLPALLQAKTPRYLYIVNILLFNFIVVLSFMLFYHKFNIPNFYNKYHNIVSYNNLLTIENIKTDYKKKIGKIQVSYHINNNFDKELTVPLIRIRLLDKDRMMVKSYIMNQKNIKLAPSQHLEIVTTLDLVPPASALLDVTIGNNLDLILH